MRATLALAVLIPAILLALFVLTPARFFINVPFVTPPWPGNADWADQTGLQRGFVEVPGLGVTVSYVRAGDPAGQRVIFVHGTPGYAGDFTWQLRHVPPGRDYIAVDRPGFGWSDTARAFPDLEDQVKALDPFLDPARPAILVGFSLGGPIVVRAAIDRSAAVAGLVLASGNLDPALEEWKWYNAVADSDFLKPLLRTDWRLSNEELRPHRAELEALAGRLAEIEAPVALVHARDDSLVPFANMLYAKAQLSRAPLVHERVLDVGDHMVPIRRPELIAEALDALIGADEMQAA